MAPFPAQQAAVVRSAESTLTESIEDRTPPNALSDLFWSGEISVGKTHYPLRGGLHGEVFPLADGWQVQVEGLSPLLVGQGRTIQMAQDDLIQQVHLLFQCLYARRLFQMTAEEQTSWKVLTAVIDAAAYENETPVRVREIGTVLWNQDYRYGFAHDHLRVRWNHGPTEDLMFSVAPPELARLRPGMWFEAIVARSPETGALVEILQAGRMASPDDTSDEELDELQDAAIDSRALPEADPLSD